MRAHNPPQQETRRPVESRAPRQASRNPLAAIAGASPRVLQLRAMEDLVNRGRQPSPSGVVQRLEFTSEAVAVESFNQEIAGAEPSRETFALAKEYLEYAQEQHWDDLEDVAIHYVRRIEDEETEQFLGPPRNDGPAMWFIDELPGPLAGELGDRYRPYLDAALRGLPLGRVGGFVEADIKPIAKLVKPVIDLFFRVESILRRGVLKPTDLRVGEFTPSSDSTTQDKVSFFDIDLGRGGGEEEEERFRFPGHQSIGPVLERRGDAEQNVNRLVAAARANKATALRRLQEFRDMINLDFPGTFGPNEDAAHLDQLLNKIANGRVLVGELYPLLAGFIVRQPEMRAVLEGRAARSALFVSSGQRLAESSVSELRETAEPRVQELRARRSLNAGAITHVLLPETLRYFVPFLTRIRDDVSFRFVGNTAEPVQVGYYDEASRTRTSVNIVVPNYQAALDRLINVEGHRSLLTHISNIE